MVAPYLEVLRLQIITLVLKVLLGYFLPYLEVPVPLCGPRPATAPPTTR